MAIKSKDNNIFFENSIRLKVLSKMFVGKRVFLSGGTGFFGKWLQLSFDYMIRQAEIKAELVVLSRDPEKFLKNNPAFKELADISYVQGDIRDFDFPEGEFDYVIHAATEASAKLIIDKPDEMYSVIVDGTKHILEMCAEKEVKKLLYVSSGAVYGIQPPDLLNIPEDYPCKPVNAYGKGKLEAENMCLASSVDTVIARCFAFIGPYLPLNTHFAIGNFINNVLNDQDINIQGDGSPYRSYMYASDLVEWLLTILLKGKSNEVYNVGSDKAVSIAELAKHVSKFSLSEKQNINIAKEKTDGTLASRYVPSTDKAKKELGLECKISLKESIQKTINNCPTDGTRDNSNKKI